jgi:hypothetical protein
MSTDVSLIAPQEVVTGARAVMGGIDLDPFSTVDGNRLINASRYFNKDQEDLSDIANRSWRFSAGQTRIFVAPLGGAKIIKSLLNKTLRAYRIGDVTEAVIWLPNNESLARLPWLWNFPLCIPFRRLRPCWWDEEKEAFKTVSPAYWSPIIYLPPTETPALYQEKLFRFHSAFSHMGRIILDESSDLQRTDDWEDAYKANMRKPFDWHW